MLQVQQGMIDVEVSGHAHTLEAGDVLTFFGDADHSYSNPSYVPARFTLAVYEPGVGHTHNTDTADA